MFLLRLPLQSWDYKCEPPWLVDVVLGMEPRVLHMVGKHVTNWATCPVLKRTNLSHGQGQGLEALISALISRPPLRTLATDRTMGSTIQEYRWTASPWCWWELCPTSLSAPVLSRYSVNNLLLRNNFSRKESWEYWLQIQTTTPTNWWMSQLLRLSPLWNKIERHLQISTNKQI